MGGCVLELMHMIMGVSIHKSLMNLCIRHRGQISWIYQQLTILYVKLTKLLWWPGGNKDISNAEMICQQHFSWISSQTLLTGSKIYICRPILTHPWQSGWRIVFALLECILEVSFLRAYAKYELWEAQLKDYFVPMWMLLCSHSYIMMLFVSLVYFTETQGCLLHDERW